VTRRDRIVILAVLAAGIIAAFWFLVLAPKRDEAAALDADIAKQEQRLQVAQNGAQAAAAAKARYERDYAAVAKLGQAVPADDDVPSLVFQLDRAAEGDDVDFRSLKLEAAAGNSGKSAQPAQGAPPASSGGATANAPATQAAAASLPPGATVGSAGFPTMPFTFVFDGTFGDMESFLGNVARFTKVRNDNVEVTGRLLTVDSIKLSAGRRGFPQVSAEIRATAYVLPAGEGLTAGATPRGPQVISSPGSAGGTSSPALTTGGSR
jgi:hypothetical protein